MERQLHEVYYNPLTGFMSLDKFKRKVAEAGHHPTNKQLKDFLDHQLTVQLNKQTKLPSTYSTYWVHNIRDNYQIDLMVYDRFPFNNYKYILCVIDIKSRYAQAEPLTNRSMPSIIEALKKICEHMGWPKGISADREFDKTAIKNLFNQHAGGNATFQFSDPEQIHKNPIVERWHRTLAGRLQKWRASKPGLRDWPNILPKIVEAYNNSYHRNIYAKPIDIWEGRDYNRQPKIEVDTTFNLGDRVRYRLERGPLRKGDRITYSKEVYIVHNKIGKRFELIDLQGNVQSRKRNDYELLHAREFVNPEGEEKKDEGDIVMPRRVVRSDVDVADIREGRRERRPNPRYQN